VQVKPRFTMVLNIWWGYNTQHNDTKYKRLICDTQHKQHWALQITVKSATMLIIVILSVATYLMFCWTSLCSVSLRSKSWGIFDVTEKFNSSGEVSCQFIPPGGSVGPGYILQLLVFYVKKIYKIANNSTIPENKIKHKFRVLWNFEKFSVHLTKFKNLIIFYCINWAIWFIVTIYLMGETSPYLCWLLLWC
jgi:hypothetical protein